MTTVGHARVSSTGQDLTVQIEKLEGAGCTKIFKENVSPSLRYSRQRFSSGRGPARC